MSVRPTRFLLFFPEELPPSGAVQMGELLLGVLAVVGIQGAAHLLWAGASAPDPGSVLARANGDVFLFFVAEELSFFWVSYLFIHLFCEKKHTIACYSKNGGQVEPCSFFVQAQAFCPSPWSIFCLPGQMGLSGSSMSHTMKKGMDMLQKRHTKGEAVFPRDSCASASFSCVTCSLAGPGSLTSSPMPPPSFYVERKPTLFYGSPLRLREVYLAYLPVMVLLTGGFPDTIDQQAHGEQRSLLSLLFLVCRGKGKR
jgi:hypothetical protein